MMQGRMAGALGVLSVSLFLACAPAAQAQSGRLGNFVFTAQAPAVEQPGRREWAWQGSDALSYAGPGRVRYEPGGTPRIIVTGDPAEVQNVEVDGGDIRERDTPRFFNFTRGEPRLEILVQGVTLDKFELAGSATMELGRLQRDTLDLKVHGSGTVNAQGQARKLSLEVNGSGRANLDQFSAGEASIAVNGSGLVSLGAVGGDASIRVTGSGKAKAGAVGKSADIVTTGSGTVTLGRVDNVNAKVTGSGTVKLASQPQNASYDVLGSGKILLVGPDGNTTELARMQRGERRARPPSPPRPPRPPSARDTDPGDRN